MIQYYTYLTKCGGTVYKSINDKKQYRFIKLENRLKVFIIQDEKRLSTGDTKCDEQDNKRIRLSCEENVDSSIESSSDQDESGEKMAAIALTVQAGSFDDPKELQGLAHFTEHVVLMGNEQYPTVNEFDNYLGTHSGYSNAHTLNEYTVYEAQLPNCYLDECLIRFAACFKKPLFRSENIETEINPLNNEFIDSFVDDDIRCNHLINACLGKKDHKFSGFFYGNMMSLKELPNSKGIDVRAKMIEFFNKHYKASRMSLVIQSQENLDKVEQYVREYFSDLPTEPNFDPMPEQINEEKLLKELLSTTNVFAKKEYPFARETMNNLHVMDCINDGHTLKLIWCFEPLAKLYKLKPLHTLGSCLGHEGTNSLITYLVKKNLVLEFIASHDDTCDFHSSQNYHSLFCLTIKLTDQGLAKIDEIIGLINYYINLMVKSGPQEQYFKEEQLISLINIRFEDEISPMTNVVQLGKQLFMYPLEYVIIGPKLLYEFNSDAIKYCLEFIKTQPKLCIIQSKKAFLTSDWPTITDFWSDIEYKVEPLPKQWNQSAIETEELITKLKMPSPNEFISSDFELKTQECFYNHPILIDEDSHYKCFFKNDKIFRKPKACINLIYQSDYLRQSPEAMVSLQLYIKYFLITIAEYVYPAESADLEYRIQISERGLELKVNGFNHKLFKLLVLILDEFTKFKIDVSLFDTIKLECIREYYNALVQNDSLVSNIVQYLFNKHQQTYIEQREWMKRLDVKTVIHQVISFFSTAYCQCLIQGNYTKKEAQDIFEYIKSTSLGIREEVNLDEIKKKYINQIPNGEHYCYIKSFNKMDENIFIFNSYLLGKLDEQQIVMLDLIIQEMYEPLFNLLRNEQTLAYYLYCKYSCSTTDICSYSIVIKSLAANFTPQYVDEQIEWFIEHFLNEFIRKMSEQHFNEIVEARIKKKSVPFVSLADEAKYNWREIYDFTYRFNRFNEEIEILKKLKLDKFIEFATHALQKSAEIKKLSVCSIGTGEKSEELFTIMNNKKLMEGDEEIEDNDKKIYSLIYAKPNELKTNCCLIDDVQKFVDERICF